MQGAALLASYFDSDIDEAKLPPYFPLVPKQPKVGTAAMDSSDQSVVILDQVTGIAACRAGINVVSANHEITYRSIGEIVYVTSHPTGPTEDRLRAKLSIEQSLRLATGRRPFYSSLRSDPPMIPPRLVAAGVRVAEDYRRLQVFANSAFAVPGMLFMADGRLNAQNFPGPGAYDLQARLLRARGIRYIALTKSGLLTDVVRAEARTIRKKLGTAPFAFSILPRHLHRAYRASGQISKSPKTIRHGASSSALGGVGAVRFALSISGDNLNIVEMSLYDFDAFSGLVRTGESLESNIARRRGIDLTTIKNYDAVYSWDVLRFVQDRDWEQHIVPTLEEVVFSAYTDTELGIYPRALADVHNHVKLHFDEPELETQRRQIIIELARGGVPIEEINIAPDGPHKTDPDEVDAYSP